MLGRLLNRHFFLLRGGERKSLSDLTMRSIFHFSIDTGDDGG